MRILLLCNDGEATYKLRKELINKLIEKNFEVFVSLPYSKYSPLLKDLGCEIIDTQIERKSTNPITDMKLKMYYDGLLSKIKPDVVLGYTIKPNIYGGMACAGKHIPFIPTITGISSTIENGGVLEHVVSCLYKIGLHKANKVFFQNSTNMEYMLNKKIIKKEQAILVPGSGVNVDDYYLLPYPEEDKTNFVFIGRMMEEKGFGLYLNAAKELKKKYPHSYYHIAGLYEDDYKEEVDKLINEDIIIYHGSVIDMVNEIYKIIHCNVMPTYYSEGMSNVLLESASSGRPNITTDRPGCKEAVEDGYNGIIVKQRDGQDLIDKMEKFINLSYQDKKQMGINGRTKMISEFNRNIVVDSYIKEIEKFK